jgi:tRNA 5-methylaminomethyl-2-thiouridine biosynthesis bifunctional protein
MAGAVDWRGDSTPASPRFFLHGCDLPRAWAGQPQWRILETGFGLGLNFLATWQAWRADPARPRMLHFASVAASPVAAADLLRAAAAEPDLLPLARELVQQWSGLTPGLHRLAFDAGQVLLTLGIGDGAALLRALAFRADAVFLDGFDPERNPALWELGTLKAVARLCRRGTALATWTAADQVRHDLGTCGFVVEKVPGLAPRCHALRARYAPAWVVKGGCAPPAVPASRCLVIGAGLAGAAVAASLARRGWDVQVLDRAAAPASGASALPAGLLAPHQSPDDDPLSRLSRAGIRITLQACTALLAQGDWQATGVLENRCGDPRPLPPVPELQAWSDAATPAQRAAASLAAEEPAWWHANAGWVRPAALVQAWLAQAGVTFRGGCAVAALARRGEAWVAADAAGGVIAAAPLVVVAAAQASGALLAGRIAVHPVRGQVSWGAMDAAALPPFPVHGHGHFVPGVPTPQGPAWVAGSTYGPGETDAAPREADQHANLERLRVLLPAVAAQLAPQFAGGKVRAWNGVRCASADRRPLVGELEPGLWVSTAMGSRGLTFAALAGELVAARLHGEPLPLEAKLARALDAGRHPKRQLSHL